MTHLQKSKGSLLIVDDQPENVRLLLDILADNNYHVRIAVNGKRALTSIALEPPDLILLDIVLPDQDGFTICETLKKNEETRDIPVVFVSALNDVTDKVRSFKAGGVDFITKPFNTEEVLARVNTHLTICNLQKTVSEQNIQLKKAQEKLEQRLDERTREIITINEELKEEIKEKQRIERALRASEESNRHILNNTTIGLCQVDEDKNFISVNPALGRLLDDDPVNLLRSNLLNHILADDLPQIRDHFNKAKAGNKGFNNLEVRFCDQAGKVIYALLGCTPVFNNSKKILHYIIHIQNISTIVNLQNQLRHAQKMEAIGTLAGGIAHDFNNILSLIEGWAEISTIHHLTKDHPAYSCNEKIITATNRAKRLIQQILTFSRKGENKPEIIELSPLIKEVVKLLKATLSPNINIFLDLDASQDSILATPDVVYQILMNLGSNASHAMKKNGGSLTISLTNQTLEDSQTNQITILKSGEYLKLTIEDTGDGMTEAVLQRAFEPYFTTKPIGEGTGLGLSVVHGIVSDLNGTISVESRLNKGTCFTILIPTFHEKAEISLDQQPSIATEGGNEGVLLVDNEPEQVEIGKQILESLGYKVTTSSDSSKALELFQDSPQSFDILITDMMMPKMMGTTLAKELVKIRPNIAILICSGLDQELMVDMLEETKRIEFLPKPISYKKLATSIRNLLDNEVH